MVSRKRRTAVVLDTNVLVGALKSRFQGGPNQRVLRLWLERRRLQPTFRESRREFQADFAGRPAAA